MFLVSRLCNSLGHTRLIKHDRLREDHGIQQLARRELDGVLIISQWMQSANE